MDTEDEHAGRVNKRIRTSLPHASGALSTVTTAASARGELVRAAQNLHEDPRRQVVEIDVVAADQEQFTAIIGAIKDLDGVLVEAETDPALESHHDGTIAVQSKVPFRNEQDFSTVYTPGAARMAQAVRERPAESRRWQAVRMPRPYDRRCMMPHDEEWLEVLLKRWTSLTPEVRGQLQTYMGLPPRDRKNQRRLEKKLKTAACKSETFRHDTAERKVHP